MEEKKENNLTSQQIELLIQNELVKFANSLEKNIEEKNKLLKQQQATSENIEKEKRGIPLSGYLEFTKFFTSQASNVNRSLSLGGIAIIWIFKKPSANSTIVHDLLNFPLWCLSISLAIDLLQYTFGAIAWSIFYERKYYLWRKKENYKPDYVKDIEAPNLISQPINFLFLTKIIFTIIAYWNIVKYLLCQF